MKEKMNTNGRSLWLEWTVTSVVIETIGVAVAAFCIVLLMIAFVPGLNPHIIIPVATAGFLMAFVTGIYVLSVKQQRLLQSFFANVQEWDLVSAIGIIVGIVIAIFVVMSSQYVSPLTVPNILAFPFLVIYGGLRSISYGYTIGISVILGGVLGITQWFVLQRSGMRHTHWWIWASILGGALGGIAGSFVGSWWGKILTLIVFETVRGVTLELIWRGKLT